MCKIVKLETDNEKKDQFVKKFIQGFCDEDDLSEMCRDYDEEIKDELYHSKFLNVLVQFYFDANEKKLVSSFEKLEKNVRVQAIHFMAAIGLTPALKILAKKSKKFDVNAEDSFNRTPLFNATSNSCFKGVMTLIELGADIHHLDSFGRSFVHMVSYAKLPFVKKLYKYTIDHPDCGFKFDFKNPTEALVPIMIHEGSLSTAKWLIEELNCDVNAVDEYGKTALYYEGLFNNHPKKMLYLIEHGAVSTEFSENAFKMVNDKLCKLRKKIDDKVCSVEDLHLFDVLQKFYKSI